MKVYQIQKRTILESPNNWVSTIQYNDLEVAINKVKIWIATMKESKLLEFSNCQNDIRVVELENDVIQNYHYFISSN